MASDVLGPLAGAAIGAVAVIAAQWLQGRRDRYRLWAEVCVSNKADGYAQLCAVVMAFNEAPRDSKRYAIWMGCCVKSHPPQMTQPSACARHVSSCTRQYAAGI
jgi:hypothetical protein